MSRIRLLVLSLLAVFAFSAVATASSAFAFTEFKSTNANGSYKIVKALNNQVFTVETAKVTCEAVAERETGHVVNKAGTGEEYSKANAQFGISIVAPLPLSKCTTLGFAVTFTSKCWFEFHLEAGTTRGTADIKNNGVGCVDKFEVPKIGCVIEIGTKGNQGLSNVEYANKGAFKAELKLRVHNITFTNNGKCGIKKGEN